MPKSERNQKSRIKYFLGYSVYTSYSPLFIFVKIPPTAGQENPGAGPRSDEARREPPSGNWDRP